MLARDCKLDDRVAGTPDIAAAGSDDDELAPRGLVGHRCRPRPRGKRSRPQLASGFDIKGVECAIERGADEHQAACSDDWPAEVRRSGDAAKGPERYAP